MSTSLKSETFDPLRSNRSNLTAPQLLQLFRLSESLRTTEVGIETPAKDPAILAAEIKDVTDVKYATERNADQGSKASRLFTSPEGIVTAEDFDALRGAHFRTVSTAQ